MARLRFCFRFHFWIVAALVFAGCSSPLPSTELPPARFISAAPEFPGFHDYRGIFDLPMNALEMDQAAVAGLAKTSQIDFIFLANRVHPGDTDFGIAGFTDDILFISGGAFEVGGSVPTFAPSTFRLSGAPIPASIETRAPAVIRS